MSLAQQFEQLWSSSLSNPDVFSFLNQQNTADSDQWLSVLLIDQQRRWATDSPLQVEDYLDGLQDLPRNVDWKLQLAIGEFQARRDTKQPLSVQEISSRFPDLSDTLRDRLRQLTSADQASTDTDSKSRDDSAIDLREVDQICDAFEAAWNRAGETPRLEDFLQRATPNSRDTLLPELIQVELWWRKKRGEQPNRTDYADRFPDHAMLFQKLLSQPVVSSRRQSRHATYLSADRLPQTEFKVHHGGSTAATYITSNAVGVQQKGRYRLDRVLGEGAFGRVYLGFDEELLRQVAIKVPTKARFKKPEDAEAYLAEARTVASLDHPHIVPVYDMGRTEDGSIYVVSKFIEGSTLEDRIKAGRLPERESAHLLVTVALALQHAHDRRLIHRDIKPANILLEGKSNAPYVADFGLAIREEDYLQQNAIAGTPAYMSPEQIRGEGHRLDGRSDIFSLGVVLYELLTGSRPFRGSSPLDTVHLVVTQEPRPLREYFETIPAELERICLKALSKRASDRYATAAEFADDLGQWLKPVAPVVQAKAAVQVVPKGLRSFDAGDADFFLDLLPGPRNRDGLPESIAFWKQRIEQTDPDQTFSVGLIYGPSGCGKSSLVKAGLLPHLSDSVIAVYVEATADDTETRILRGLRKRFPELSEELGLADTLAAVRRGVGCQPANRIADTEKAGWKPAPQKVVIIIDQFEQWLHAHRVEPDTELVRALRQCDGGRLQCVVMVRDDFYVAALRLMQALDIEVVPGRNFLLVDLFDVDHARKVLIRFGQAFGKLPANAANLSTEAEQFVCSVASGLAEDGKVISVRLSLLAEMVKAKSWQPATLEQVGGTAGIGVNFLEETFASVHADPRFRRHSVATRGVLRALLPALDTDIKGGMRSHADLLAASGYEDRPSDFADLLRILDGELRLITPTDPEGDSLRGERQGVSPPSLQSKYYQLTHDYLVPSLREWLTRKQKETRKGRAELKLGERSAIWDAKRENKQLPTVTEWLSIRTLTDSKRWTAPQRAMMHKAARVHGTLWGGLLLGVLLVTVGIQQWASAERWKSLREQTRAAAESLQNNLGPSVPVNIRELRRLPAELVLPELQTRFTSATNTRHKLSLAFGLAGYGELDAEYLVSRIDDIAEVDTSNFVTALQANPTTALITLKAEASKCADKPLWRRKTKLAIMALRLGDTELALDVCAFENRPDPEQRTLFIDEFRRWDVDLKGVLEAVKNSDSPALRSGICLAVGQVSVEKIIDTDKEIWKSLASQWFVEHGDTTTHSATGWLLRHWKSTLPEIPHPDEITPQRDWFQNSVGSIMLRIRPEPPDPIEKYRQKLVELQNVATAKLEEDPEIRMERASAHFEVGNLDLALEDLDVLMENESSEAFSRVLMFRTLTLARMGKADATRQSLARYLEQGVSASRRAYMEIQIPAWLGDIAEASRQLEGAAGDASAGQDLLYDLACAAALCAQATAAKDPEQSQRFANRAIELLKRSCAQSTKYHLYGATEDPDFSVLHGDARFAAIFAEIVWPALAAGAFWVCDREVTRGQFEEFMNDPNYAATEKPAEWEGVDADLSPTADHPAQYVNWFDCVMYCNWLSQREGLPPCYKRIDENNAFGSWDEIGESTGYRLLHEAELEYACRAGTSTKYSSGDDETLLVGYSQMYPSKLTAVCGEKLPNAWGLHDLHGNVEEWCWQKEVESHSRVLLGGSFASSASLTARFGRGGSLIAPDARIVDYGFRVARTIKPIAHTALPPAEGGAKFEN